MCDCRRRNNSMLKFTYNDHWSSYIRIALVMFMSLLFLAGCQQSQPTAEQSLIPTFQIPEPDKDLELVLDLNKHVYTQNDEIVAKLTIRYIGDNKYTWINTSFEPGLDYVLEIKNEQGVVIGLRGKKLTNYLPILPYNDLFVPLQNHTEFSMTTSSLRERYAFDDPGKYTVRAIYINGYEPDDGRQVWKGTIVSDEVEFTLSP